MCNTIARVGVVDIVPNVIIIEKLSYVLLLLMEIIFCIMYYGVAAANLMII